jgi:hypothetical protein
MGFVANGAKSSKRARIAGSCGVGDWERSRAQANTCWRLLEEDDGSIISHLKKFVLRIFHFEWLNAYYSAILGFQQTAVTLELGLDCGSFIT